MSRRVTAVVIVSLCIVVASAMLLRTAPSTEVATGRDLGSLSPRSSPLARSAPVVGPSQDTPSVVVPTRAPIQRPATDRDLFATYRELDRSTRGGDLYVANSILFPCYLASRTDSDLRSAAAGLAVRGLAAPAAVQIEAARDLLERCSGFAGMTRLSLQQARADLRGRLDRADDPVGWGEAILRNRRPSLDDLLRSILASQDPVAIDDVAAMLFARWPKATGRPVGSDEEAVLQTRGEETVPMTLVACDLGGDCASDGFQMRQACAFDVHQCGMDLRTRVLEAFSPEDRRQMVDRAATLLRAIEDDDFAFWGL